MTAELTPSQLTFLEWITRGICVEDAAKEIDSKWSSIMEWRRTIPAFRLAFEEALECRAMLIRERAHQRAFDALDVLCNLVRDFKASPSIRLRASLMLIKRSTTPAAAAKRKIENMHNPGQTQPIRRPVEPGRNSVCPCGSGVKFKRCCGNPVPATSQQTTEEAAAA